MKRTRFLWANICAVAACAVTIAGAPAGGGGFTLPWQTIDSGGGTSAGGSYSLTGTIGQPDAGGPMTGNDYALVGGFWPGGGAIAPPCTGDLDGDDNVGFSDLVILLASWGSCPGGGDPCPQDIDGNGDIGFGDLVIVLAAWGPCS